MGCGFYFLFYFYNNSYHLGAIISAVKPLLMRKLIQETI